ncbi:hypothetical protein TNCV_1910681 [Trichonephila clavipes]|nr:hypothetical protein TNCV_1910681 [Trichonephila clavipes]
MPGKRARRPFSQLSEFERRLIIGMKTAGWTTRRVAGQVDRSECAVRNCWEQWTREEANLKSKHSFHLLPLTPENRQLRLQWCQARSMWNVTDWQKVVFSDESRFVLGPEDNRVRVWRRPVILLWGGVDCAPYLGSEIGAFKTYAHDVEGRVYAVDDRTIYIKGFQYDGQGPDAFFWAGSTSKPDPSGFIIPDEKGKKVPLQAYRDKDLLLRLPDGKTLRNIKWIAVWCRKFYLHKVKDSVISNHGQETRTTNELAPTLLTSPPTRGH